MKKQHVKLTDQDKRTLQELLSKGDLNVRVQKRSMGLQMLDKGMTFQAVKEHLNTSHITISNWAKRYAAEGLSMIYDKPRSGRPIGLSGEDRAKVTALACSKPPVGYARWSLRLLADRLVELDILESISHNKVGEILKKTNFSPIGKSNGASES